MPGRASTPARCHVALLRGVNVGRKNRVRMPALVEMFEDAGCRDVRTYIQSGNVVFTAPASIAREAGPTVERSLEKRLGIEAPVVVRSGEQMRSALANCPFEGADPDELCLMFLKALPRPAAVAKLYPQRSPPDSFIVKGREVYLRLPGGAARSKLTNAYFDRVLKTVSTARNWRTVRALVEMVGGA